MGSMILSFPSDFQKIQQGFRHSNMIIKIKMIGEIVDYLQMLQVNKTISKIKIE